jgi:aspartyl-tRNA(Asn)/glutamyl-tRNA(Gln) amidotransferase subunit A
MTPNPAPSPTINSLAEALRRHETSATRLVAQALRRIREHNPALNAFALVDEDGARRAARTADEELAAGIDRGPLHGVPVAVKDLIDMAGLPTTCGSATSFGATAIRDAEVVRRLRGSGAVIVGKTTLHEFAYGATGDRSVHGASRNPHDPSRISGGSSGGSAVAVAAGMVPLSVGTDTAGSVRVPAALCGVVGLKPAYDAIPTEGVYPLAPTLDHVGLFARTVDDVRLGYQALDDESAESRQRAEDSLTVGWIAPQRIAMTDPRIEVLAHESLVRAGLTPAPVHGFPQRSGEQSLFEMFSVLQGKEAFQVHEHHLARDHDRIDPEVLARLQRGRDISGCLYARAEDARRELRATVGQLLQAHRVLALPTTPIVAPHLDVRSVQVAETTLEVRSALLSLTSPWNLTGMPAISVPVGWIDELPVAVQLVTAPGDEHLIFAGAEALQAIAS